MFPLVIARNGLQIVAKEESKVDSGPRYQPKKNEPERIPFQVFLIITIAIANIKELKRTTQFRLYVITRIPHHKVEEI